MIPCLFYVSVLAAVVHAQSFVAVGADARRFLNTDLHGKSVALSELVGAKAKSPKPLVMSFWALWCTAEGKACAREMPIVQSWVERNAGKVELLFVNIDPKSDGAMVRDYADAHKLAGKVLLDFYQTTAKAYGVCEGAGAVCKVPSLVVVNPQGRVVLAEQGFHGSAQDLESALDRAAFGVGGLDPSQGKLSVAEKRKIMSGALRSVSLPTLAKSLNLKEEQVRQVLLEAEEVYKREWKD